MTSLDRVVSGLVGAALGVLLTAVLYTPNVDSSPKVSKPVAAVSSSATKQTTSVDTAEFEKSVKETKAIIAEINKEIASIKNQKATEYVVGTVTAERTGYKGLLSIPFRAYKIVSDKKTEHIAVIENCDNDPLNVGDRVRVGLGEETLVLQKNKYIDGKLVNADEFGYVLVEYSKF